MSERLGKPKTQVSRLLRLPKYCGKTSTRLGNRGPRSRFTRRNMSYIIMFANNEPQNVKTTTFGAFDDILRGKKSDIYTMIAQ